MVKGGPPMGTQSNFEAGAACAEGINPDLRNRGLAALVRFGASTFGGLQPMNSLRLWDSLEPTRLDLGSRRLQGNNPATNQFKTVFVRDHMFLFRWQRLQRVVGPKQNPHISILLLLSCGSQHFVTWKMMKTRREIAARPKREQA